MVNKLRAIQIPPRPRYSSEAEIEQFLKREKLQRVKKIKKFIPKRIKRTYSVNQRMTVVYLRYGSISNFTNTERRWNEISRLTNISQDTCLKIVQAFHAKGNQMESKTRRGPKRQPVPKDIEEYLKESLVTLKFLSLRKRQAMLSTRFNFNITVKRLREFYIRLGVRYQAADCVLANASKAAYVQQRVQFARQLVSLLIMKRRIIFADESSTNMWAGVSYIKKTWQYPSQPIQHKLSNQRLKSVTLIGAVSSFTKAPMIGIYNKTDTESWKEFLVDLKAMLDKEHIRTKVFLVVDNHSCHHVRSLRRYYEPFHVLYLPPYSSQFNAIEYCWAIVKRELALHISRLPDRKHTQISFEAEVDYVISQVSATYKNKTFIKRMQKYLASKLI